jgi:UDP-N-acetylmuramate dehydrogenase
MIESIDKIITKLESLNIHYKINEPLAMYTTWKIGGPADLLIKAHTIEELLSVKKLSLEFEIPITILGSGSNTLISDDGIRGIVIINKINHLKINDELVSKNSNNELTQPRLNQIQTDKYYSFDKHNYDESDKTKVKVTVGSGSYLPLLINQTIDNGVTGLQWFSGIPGTLGGAVYNNIHGGSHYMSEFIESVTIMNKLGVLSNLNKEQCKFDYDYSIFHENHDIILEVELTLYKGDTAKAREVAMHWAQDKKTTQPYNSAGCCFQNLPSESVAKLNFPTGSWGYIIEHVLNLKGRKIGGAIISTKHAAFIENTGKATAQDILSLIDLVYSESIKKLNIRPKLEIFLLGFPESTLKRYVS